MISQLALFSSTILFWISLVGTVVLCVHPRIRNYVIPGEKLLSFSQAGIVLFTGLYSSSILYWSLFETFLFKDDPNFIALFPDKVGNAPFLTSVTLYNWGVTFYLMLFLGVISCLFVSKFKDKYISDKYKNFLFVVFSFLALFSTCRILGSLASYILPVQYLLNYFSGINSSLFIVLSLCAIVLWSALGGIKHIKSLANICVFFVLMYSVLIFTKLFYSYNVAGYLLNVTFEFLHLCMNFSFIEAQFTFNNQFVEDWTTLYFALQIASTLPAFYFFYIALQGRTVKEFVLLFNVFCILPTIIIFCVNSTLVQILIQELKITLTADTLLDMYPVLFNFVNLGYIPAVILFFSMLTLIVTSVDSIIFACAKYLGISTEGKNLAEKKGYVCFALGYVLLLGAFLLYILSFKSKPALAIRLYEMNFYACVVCFIPFLYIIYAVIVSFSQKNKSQK